jgi:Protein of unknown function (DUF4043)
MVTRFITAIRSSLVCFLWRVVGGYVLARDTTPIAPLMGEGENSIIQVKTENGKEKGDSVTFALLARLASDGFSEGQVAIERSARPALLRASTRSITSVFRSSSPKRSKAFLGL